MGPEVETALIVGLVGVNAVLGVSFGMAMRRQGAPFVPTAAAKIRAVFGAEKGLLARVLGPSRGDLHLVDLGSGEGAMVRAAVREGGFGRATGYELNPALLVVAQLRSMGRGVERHVWKSLWLADLSEANVVFVYGVPPIMERLGRKLLRELPDGSLVVSNNYALVGLGPPLLADDVDTPLLAPDGSGPVYVYRLSSGRGGLGAEPPGK
ncbi:hypothetical protein T492DRAFT_1075531 [Pavlovales sp. CCMP2436]|nr:hypothetical protein T492DRAFT_1075531 [Pavlovales sp. CCMP2436]|eukprot:CAMPEP_0179844910 /NCGR_PEP_ID=MMETSP0982-20121206/4621_1 /TAXON_ID=483367 /ORGANISM="non described non described, Strain CCMP 2436" /LENGTH=208 /DNA_ID=CAMNT_0021729699 /DNA_START=105 /DNA_END=731 /DNA_ORIENTATION=-